ncbi:spore germination protein GerPB [Neobacillus pocheonensis]|uniref:Spore germination protein GerPB n=1 Tax=Neobacillus pocheonensis TaxID=363869 RepID=A0ABT0WBN6_9BACI|nr:spore germination protein GerPB [Neobacillus pocheonensis]
MNFYIQQSIQINFIKINGITNSSVLQIGSAGIIRPAAYLYNTGGFTQTAPSAQKPFAAAGGAAAPSTAAILAPSVPLQSPVRRAEK